MPTAATCPACHGAYVVRSSLQDGGLCPTCRRAARQARMRRERAEAGLCTTCGHRCAQPGGRTCAGCIASRVARGFKPRTKEAR